MTVTGWLAFCINSGHGTTFCIIVGHGTTFCIISGHGTTFTHAERGTCRCAYGEIVCAKAFGGSLIGEQGNSLNALD